MSTLTSQVYYFRRSAGAAKEEIDFALPGSPLHRLNPTLMADMTAMHHIHEPGTLLICMENVFYVISRRSYIALYLLV